MTANIKSTVSSTNSLQSSISTAQVISNNTETDSSKVADKSHRSYRTKAKCGDTAEIPDRLPIITNQTYQNALTFNNNDYAYLQMISDSNRIKYENGNLMFKGLPATSAELNSVCTDENIEKVNIPLLLALYGILLTKYQNAAASDEQADNKATTIYYPEFAKKIGKSPNTSKKDVQECLNSIRQFQSVLGIINNGLQNSDILPVINRIEYDSEKNTISFTSPYLSRIIKDIHTASIRKDRKGLPRLKKNGEPLMLPSHSYLVDMSIVSEKNKKAVEIVFIIIVLVEQAGNHTPNIRPNTIISRCPRLHKSLTGQSAGNKNTLLKRAFTKAWQLLREKTALTTVYNNIQLPDFNDITAIPTGTTLNKALTFSHNGKGQKP